METLLSGVDVINMLDLQMILVANDIGGVGSTANRDVHATNNLLLYTDESMIRWALT